jgi:very-short-patch-repair endonuclease/DNA polymerase III delta prime subunit
MPTINELVAQGIRKLRLKLLDLTNRNRLLNFKFPEKTRKFVRVVDELPDALYERLAVEGSGGKLWFRALPEPPVNPEGTLVSIASRQAVAGGTAVAAMSPGRRGTAGAARRPDRSAWARDNGIEPSFDLPEPRGAARRQHGDDQIQTLLFPEELDRVLAAIREDANVAQQELGLSTLYAAFGYLEWYEAESSEQPQFAPLVLLPLQINRELRHQQYRYYVAAGEGAEPTVNISLRERLREDFGLQLPDLEEDETPEEYFARVTTAIRGQQRWKVRRFVVIGHFSFARLVMYEDLAPERWGASGLDSHPLVSTLLAGGDGRGDVHAVEFEVDREEIENQVPVLITDADSSQLSAIVDAMQGRSFALKGPPGTGKSQTITNLIAAALAAKKRVLFVAEKQAALEVVAKRLRDAKLGPYLLELHSTKIHKRKVLDSFAERLDIRRRRTDAGLEAKLASLRETRRQLRWYVELLNAPVGTSGLTLHNAYWLEQRRRRELQPAELARVAGLEREQFASISPDQYAAACALMDQLGRAYQRAEDAAGSMDRHPWFGIRQPGLTLGDQHEVRSHLERWRAAAVRVQAVVGHAQQSFHESLPDRPDRLRTLSVELRALPEVPAALPSGLLERISGDAELAELQQVARNARDLVARHTKLSATLAEPLTQLPHVDDLQKAATSMVVSLRCGGLDAETLEEVPAKILGRRAALATVGRSLGLLEQVAAQAGGRVTLTAATLDELAAAAELVRKTPLPVLAARSPALFTTDARAVLGPARDAARAYAELAAALAPEVTLTGNEDANAVASDAERLRDTHPFLGAFSAEYRAARARAKKLFRGTWPGRAEAVARLERAVDVLRRRAALDADTSLQQFAGRHFEGAETPFDTLIGVVDYWDSVRAGWPSLDLERAPIQALLLHGQTELLDEWRSGMSEQAWMQLRELVPTLAGASEQTVSERMQLTLGHLAAADRAFATLIEVKYAAPPTVSDLPNVFGALVAWGSVLRTLQSLPLARPVLAADPLDAARAEALEQGAQYAAAVLQSSAPPNLRRMLLSGRAGPARQRAIEYAGLLAQAVESLDAAQQTLLEAAALSLPLWHRTRETDAVTLGQLVARLDEALAADEATVNAWAQFRDLVHRANTGGLAAFGEVLWKHDVRPPVLTTFFQVAYLRSLIRHVTRAHPTLPQWTGEHIDALRRRLCELDREYTDVSRSAVAALLSAVEIPDGVSQGPVGAKTERALIEWEIGKQRRHIPIRALMQRAREAAQALKPCFMMSPASVAQFLPTHAGSFDIAIIDEASQMRPEEALGVLGRAKQIVVVGDPMQLPPTSFFDASRDEAEAAAEDEVDVDTESVLDLALSSMRPSRELRWHYRSEHHSLIAFSNRRFYGDRLVVFPSPAERSPTLGVQLVPVAAGAYGSSVNLPEADTVVEAVCHLIRTRPDVSIGVVAVNQPQKDLLLERFDHVFAHDDALEAYRARWEDTLEPFFVKNLENVQGDERDVIVISTVYGPTQPGGPVMQRFGPINTRMGHRRLNVLFTRAKKQVLLVTSLKSEDVLVQAGSSAGVAAFKHYLEYARSGRLEAGENTGLPPDSPFEQEVADVLRELGYSSARQVGVAGYRIDLAVRHPINTDHFVVGIECDGATYHSAKSVRDRDRLREEVLRRLGWDVYRIWSTDWFGARDREIKKLDAYLKDRIAGC